MWLEFTCSANQHVKRTNSESAHVRNLDNIEDCFVRQGVVSPKVLSSKPSYSTYWNLLETAYILRRALTREFSNRRRRRQSRQAVKYFDIILVFFWACMKRSTIILEILTTFCRRRGNWATEVSHESRTAQMSALFHIFTCAFCLV